MSLLNLRLSILVTKPLCLKICNNCYATMWSCAILKIDVSLHQPRFPLILSWNQRLRQRRCRRGRFFVFHAAPMLIT
jgi:hypothetical protein